MIKFIDNLLNKQFKPISLQIQGSVFFNQLTKNDQNHIFVLYSSETDDPVYSLNFKTNSLWKIRTREDSPTEYDEASLCLYVNKKKTDDHKIVLKGTTKFGNKLVITVYDKLKQNRYSVEVKIASNLSDYYIKG
jgi:hypothetical protein